jgi:hypothetical protein
MRWVKKKHMMKLKMLKITPFYSYLFEVMKPYDSTYSNEKEAEIQGS